LLTALYVWYFVFFFLTPDFRSDDDDLELPLLHARATARAEVRRALRRYDRGTDIGTLATTYVTFFLGGGALYQISNTFRAHTTKNKKKK
jgi:hypothetical protein